MRRIGVGLAVLCAACASGAGGVGGGGSGARAPRVPSIPAIRSELTREQQIDHALNRLSYGSRPGDEARLKAMGLERWIALQLTPERVADRRTDSIVASYASLNTPTSELTSAQRDVRVARRDTARSMAEQAALRLRQRMLQASQNDVAVAKLTRAVTSERQLYEQMVDFWENHFSVFSNKGQTRLFIPAYDRDAIRPHAMGRFRDLLGAVAKSPAMLFYLDNAQSTADSGRRTLMEGRSGGGQRAGFRGRRGLNENYARELMELHTLGVDGGYTQTDVIEVARALTGWSIEPGQGVFVFRPLAHDAEEKTVLGSRLSAGRGIEDGEEVLDLLARHPSTARYITRKLVIRFVSDSAPPALVDRCASAFTRSDGDIRETLRCVVTSREFFSPAAYRSKVKTPYELVVSAMRATNATPDRTPRSIQVVARLGQPIFGRQTPDGWPDHAQEWMNAGAMISRVNFGLALASGRMPGVTLGEVDPAVGAKIATPEFQRR